MAGAFLLAEMAANQCVMQGIEVDKIDEIGYPLIDMPDNAPALPESRIY
jgi:hypothetical protein